MLARSAAVLIVALALLLLASSLPAWWDAREQPLPSSERTGSIDWTIILRMCPEEEWVGKCVGTGR